MMMQTIGIQWQTHPKPQTEVDSSGDRVKETDVSGGQTFLKIMFDKQNPEEVK